MVRTGMIVAFTALVISTCIAPQLRTLDQAYQYIQEYTGFIYPGEFLIFFCGLFWRQATSKAALWTALLTIPLGISFKILNPEMPFILRIGYVFIILAFVMIGVSLSDRALKMVNVTDYKTDRKSVNTGIKMVSVALFIGILASFFVIPFKDFALEAIYVPVAGFILVGLIMILNDRLKKMDVNAITIGRGLFKTSMTFNIAAIGICGIFAMLYYFFW
jgi:SSS family solute:Na+ symporter